MGLWLNLAGPSHNANSRNFERPQPVSLWDPVTHSEKGYSERLSYLPAVTQHPPLLYTVSRPLPGHYSFSLPLFSQKLGTWGQMGSEGSYLTFHSSQGHTALSVRWNPSPANKSTASAGLSPHRAPCGGPEEGGDVVQCGDTNLSLAGLSMGV